MCVRLFVNIYTWQSSGRIEYTKTRVINMPYRRSPYAKAKRRTSRRVRAMGGAGFMDWIKKAGSWLSNNKILSGIGKVLTPIFPEVAGPITAGLSAVGLGRRRRRIGGALRLAGYHRGGALMPAGGGRRTRLLM